MRVEPNADDFHHSEAGDIRDLYNACNGVFRDGLLDLRMLEEYSPDEAEELNVPRLREVWAHAAAGCNECENIIKSLNKLRGAAKTACASSM